MMKFARSAACIGGIVILAACGASTSNDPNLSARANEGREIMRSNGCAACHGSSGQGGVGPSFVGLLNSEVDFVDAPSQIADREYLVESITDPSAKKRAGFNVPMPTNNLTTEQVDAVITYIEELSAARP